MTATSALARVGTFGTPTIVAIVSAVAIGRHPTAPGGWLAAMLAGVLALVAVFDMPLASSAGPTGLARRCLGRTHLLAWSEVTAIEITRSSVTAVTVHRRRYLLSAGTNRWIAHPAVPEGVAIRERV
jgi:hypothetical protein